FRSFSLESLGTLPFRSLALNLLSFGPLPSYSLLLGALLFGLLTREPLLLGSLPLGTGQALPLLGRPPVTRGLLVGESPPRCLGLAGDVLIDRDGHAGELERELRLQMRALAGRRRQGEVCAECLHSHRSQAREARPDVTAEDRLHGSTGQH